MVLQSDKVYRWVWYASKGRIKKWGYMRTFKPEVGLFTSANRWWLAYYDDPEHNTGSFPTKRDAIRFYEGGGR